MPPAAHESAKNFVSLGGGPCIRFAADAIPRVCAFCISLQVVCWRFVRQLADLVLDDLQWIRIRSAFGI